MTLLIDSKLCVTPHRILIDYDADSPECVTAVVIKPDDSLAPGLRRRNSRRAYRSAPATDLVERWVV